MNEELERVRKLIEGYHQIWEHSAEGKLASAGTLPSSCKATSLRVEARTLHHCAGNLQDILLMIDREIEHGRRRAEREASGAALPSR